MKKKIILILSFSLCLLSGLEGCQAKPTETESETAETTEEDFESAEANETQTDKAKEKKTGSEEDESEEKDEPAETAESDISLLTGAEVISEDGTVSILLPDDTFVNTNSSGSAMEFETEDENYIYVEKGENEYAADSIPESEEDFMATFEGIDADIDLKAFASDEDENGVKNVSYIVYVKDYVAYEGAEAQDFIMIENFTADGTTYYDAYAELNYETDEELVKKVSASLATFGDTAN